MTESVRGGELEAPVAPSLARRPLRPRRSIPARRLVSTRRVARAAATTALAALGVAVLSGSSASAAPVAPHPALPTEVVQSALRTSAITGLSQGARGENVRSLQEALLAAGITVRGGADGIFGPATRQAVVDFQNARGLAASGVVDGATADALAGTGSGGSGGSDGGSFVGLSRGSSGDLVRQLQRSLIDAGVSLGGGADGQFGPATERAVQQFQRWNGLGVTGTVTIATERALGLVDGGATPPSTTAPPPAPDPAPDPEPDAASEYVGLQRGSRGPAVTAVQQAIQAEGYIIRGGADGIFGPATEAVLQAYQRANGLTQSGVVGAREVELLGLGQPASPPPAEPPADEPDTGPYLGLEIGARGAAVKELQQALIDAGVTVRGGADGIFGPATQSALIAYKTSVGLPGDGIVGRKTIDKLGLGSSNGPVPLANPTTEPDPEPSAPPPTSGNPYVGLTQGDSGPLVRDLQRSLQNLGFVIVGGADGSFGGSTSYTLRAFQRVNGLPQTGTLSERGARILQLDDGTVGTVAGPGTIQMERFPMQGLCWFGDTWHAPRPGNRLHVGTDLIGAEGLLLYAVVDGTISKLYWDQPGALAGNGLRVAQDDGTYFTYLHLSGFAPGIEVGTKVKAGDVIGFNGNTGSSATPHLHFEIHPGGGAAVNPYPYLKAMDDCQNTTPQYQASFAPAG